MQLFLLRTSSDMQGMAWTPQEPLGCSTCGLTEQMGSSSGCDICFASISRATNVFSPMLLPKIEFCLKNS